MSTLLLTWIIVAPMFHGCGYIDGSFGDPHAKRGVYKDCTEYAYTLYWTGNQWSFKESEALRYVHEPSLQDVVGDMPDEMRRGIDVVETISLEEPEK